MSVTHWRECTDQLEHQMGKPDGSHGRDLHLAESRLDGAQGPARIAPLIPSEWTERVRDVFEAAEGPPARETGSKLNIVRTLARHPDLAIKYLQFGMYMLRSTSLPWRIRELATLRTAWLCNSEYEWTKHVQNALGEGMSAEEIEAIKAGSDASVWSDIDRDVLSAVDQLHTNTAIEDRTWSGLARHMDERQLLDFLFIVGSYVMLAMVLNGLRVELEQEEDRQENRAERLGVGPQ